MRPRTPIQLTIWAAGCLLVAATPVAAVSLTAPPSSSTTAASPTATGPSVGAAPSTASAPAAPAAPAGAATAAGVVDACPSVDPPKATCFAKYRPAGTGAQPAATPSGYGPADLRSAYSLPATGGSGRVIAIVDAYANPSAEADLAAYRTQFGLPACTSASGCLRIVNQDGATSPLPEADPGWGLEISLDLDMASAVCPNCSLLLVEARSNDLKDLGAAVKTAVDLGATVVSNSYGTEIEYAGEQELEELFNFPGHPIVVSAGDLGYSVSFPAAARYVTSVGGTTLTRDTTGAWTETVWSGTGSGCSAYIPKPSWQTDEHCPKRMLNDVAAVADPATGVAVYDTFEQPGWVVVGGTSASAPIVAGMYALSGTASRINDGSLPWKSHGASRFRDVTSGTNVPSPSAVTCGGDYLCTGVAGYDGPTGWGTPLGPAALAAP